MSGIDFWPDDPSDRVRLAVEPIVSTVTSDQVAVLADVSEETARAELQALSECGLVERVEEGEWRVVDEARGDDGLIGESDN